MSRPARQAIVAIYQAAFPHTPDWPEGPLPLTHEEITADTAGRSTYYPARTTRLLYGTPDHPRRWHKTLRHQAGDITVLGLEALRLNPEPGSDGLVIVHLHPGDRRAVDVVRALANRKDARLDGYDPQRLLGEQIQLSPSPPYTLSLITSRGWRLPRLYGHPRYLRWPALDQWLWAMASRTNHTDLPPDPSTLVLPDQERIWISADWCAFVLREGMALMGTRPDRGTNDPFYNHASLYTRSLYVDAILIGLMQLRGISELEDHLAAALDAPTNGVMPRLERQLTVFRNQLWWQHLSTHGTPNQILDAFHRHHRLPERFTEILAEINDFNRLTRDDETRHVNNAVVLFTLITVPAGIALALLQVLGSKDPWLFGTVLTVFALITGLLLLTRPARLVMSSIRRRLTP